MCRFFEVSQSGYYAFLKREVQSVSTPLPVALKRPPVVVMKSDVNVPLFTVTFQVTAEFVASDG
jgi:hypothetical protein